MTTRRPGSAGAGESRPGLDRRTIAEAALALVDAGGVSGFSMRKLGAALGVDPMAVYHYYPGKAAVFDGIVEIVWSSFDSDSLGSDPSAGWRQIVFEAMVSIRRMLLAHPRAIPIVGTRPVMTQEMFLLFDRAMGVLAARGLPLRSAGELFNTVALFTIGSVLAEAGEPVGGGAETLTSESVLSEMDPATIPAISEAIRLGWSWDPEAEFERGIHAILNGWEQ